MNFSKSEQRLFWSQGTRCVSKYLQKTIRALGVILLGVVGFYLLPGNWGIVSFAITPLLLFCLIVGRYFRENVLSDPNSHAPLMALGSIYMGICWYIITNSH